MMAEFISSFCPFYQWICIDNGANKKAVRFWGTAFECKTCINL